LIRVPASVTASDPCPQPVGLEYGTVPIVGTKAERRAARERVSAYPQSQLAELLSHVAAAIDRYRAGEIDAYAVDETIHHYHPGRRRTLEVLLRLQRWHPTPSSSPASWTV
jgi:hypothetical protein